MLCMNDLLAVSFFNNLKVVKKYPVLMRDWDTGCDCVINSIDKFSREVSEREIGNTCCLGSVVGAIHW
jgi:hypothetical protein